MGETSLRTLLDSAVSSEPPTERPMGRIIGDSRRLGSRLRRRRRAESAVASVASVAVVAAAVSFASGAFGHTHNQSPADHSGSPQMAYALTVSTLSPSRGLPSTAFVVPVNLATMSAGHPLQIPLRAPHAGLGIMTYSNDIVAARGGGTVYVSTRPGVILPMSTATGRVGPAIRVPGFPYEADELVGAPNGEIAYAADNSRPTITPIDLVTGSALRSISVPNASPGMGWIAVSRNGRTLLTTGGPNSDVTVVTVVTSDRAQKPITLQGHQNTGCVAVSPDGTMGYLFRRSLKARYSVVPIDVSANKALSAINLPMLPTEDHNYGLGGCSMAVAPNGRTAYVLIGRYVVPIDLVTARALTPIRLPVESFGFPELGIDPNGRMAYVLVEEGVTPIDLATNRALPTVRFSSKFSGFWLSFSPDGRTVIVGIGSTHNGKLLLIHAATGKVRKAIRVAGVPVSIAAAP